jgi:acetyltransferase-like isoleucine patch superfamily enzyme
MDARKTMQRFLVPSFVVTLVYLFRYRCKVSPRAEVELSPRLRIGQGSQISSFTKIKATDGDLVIGREVHIGTCCFISADAGGVTIGDYSMISPNVCIVGNDYRYDRMDVPVAKQEKTSKGIRIGRDVWIGAGCVVMDGADIADHCIVTPNSVVSGRLEPGAVAQGLPAKPLFVRRP